MSNQPIPRGSNVTGVVFLFLARGVLGLLGVGALFVALQGDLAAYVSWTPLAVLAMGAVALLSIGVALLIWRRKRIGLLLGVVAVLGEFGLSLLLLGATSTPPNVLGLVINVILLYYVYRFLTHEPERSLFA
ncbi:MAG: hypothetical protein IPK17_18820 [Chloroflexi bacterium]|uniref:hypothetical protein n=1 Tax=Candidatus Flexifilum breve TaxID=3140694 RepID=UPI003136C810|nr:hypothetical protein [Chloroflexota bacterium]